MERELLVIPVFLDFSGGSDNKESACGVGDLGSVPGLGRPPGEGNGYSFQYSCLENPMDRGSKAIVHSVAESDTTEATYHDTNIAVVFIGINDDDVAIAAASLYG